MTAPAPARSARTDRETEELTSRLRVAVARMNRRLRPQSLEGLSPAQVSALATVSRLGSPTLGELAAAELVQPPTMTRMVATMADAGYLLRHSDPADGRICRVTVTDDGERTLERIRSLKNAFLSERLAELSEDERHQLHELLALLERMVREP